MGEQAERIVRGLSGIHNAMADAIGNPSRVWCRTCGASQSVDAAKCLRHGWPLCCSYTMTIDAPTHDEGDAK